MPPYYTDYNYLYALPTELLNQTPMSSFLGSDFVYNFFLLRPNLKENVGKKIDDAYTNQLNTSDNLKVNAVSIGSISNSGEKFNLYSKVKFSNDPAHPMYSYIGEGGESFTGYLPTMGEYNIGTLKNNNAKLNYLNYFK